MPPSLSVLVPVYNEERTLGRLLDRVEARPEVSELVVVDDGSTDSTPEILAARRFRKPVRLIRHEENAGKGRAVRSAAAAASAELAIIQDADLELDPDEYPLLLAPFERLDVTAVFGVRELSSRTAHSTVLALGNRVVTAWANLLFRSSLRDVLTCYKVMPVRLLLALDLRGDSFDIDPEIAGKLLRSGHRIVEVPISYSGRGHAEGKKLKKWRDGLHALSTLTRIRFSRPQANVAPAAAGVGADEREAEARSPAG